MSSHAGAENPSGTLPLPKKQLDNTGPLTSDSPSQSVSALPQTVQWKEKYNCWCHPVLGQESPHEGMLSEQPQTSKSNAKCSRQESCHSEASSLITPAGSHQTARGNRLQHCRKTVQWKEKYNCWCRPVLWQEDTTTTTERKRRQMHPKEKLPLMTPARSHQTARRNRFQHVKRLSGRRSTIAGVSPCWGRKPLMKACCVRTTAIFSRSNTRYSRQESCHSEASSLITAARSHQTARRNRFQHCRKTAQWKEKYNCWCHPVLGQETPMKACCKGTTAKQQKQHQMQPTGKLPLPKKQLDNSGPLTSDSPSQSVSALPRGGSVEGEVQLLVSSHAGAGRHHDHNGEEATPNASERKAAIDDTSPLT